MKQVMAKLALVAGVAAMAGCAPTNTVVQAQPQPQPQLVVAQSGPQLQQRIEPIVVRASGYGAYTKNPRLSEGQNQLMAMRASKLDAYRALAERVYGTLIQGNSTVESLAMRDDRFRAYVDTVIRGAKVVSTYELKHGSYETTLELVLESHLIECLSNPGMPGCSVPAVHGESPESRTGARPVVQVWPQQYYLQ